MQLRETLEYRQISIYFTTIFLAAFIALLVPGTTILEASVNPALALMLFLTFLQVPLADLGRTVKRIHFFMALLITNFVIVPLVVIILLQLLSPDPIVFLGVLLVLLTPCIDYVVTFSRLGGADARLLLAATPTLLILQMLLLPAYLRLFLGDEASNLVQLAPFIHAFIWLIAAPLVLAGLVQFWAARTQAGAKVLTMLGLFPVPATALVLFVVIVSVIPLLKHSTNVILQVIPIYIGFTVLAPLTGWLVGQIFSLDAPTSRAIAFSAGTRNSLVVLPLAISMSGTSPILPAIIVTQTLVELVGELIYIRLMPKLK